ncbi:MAG: heat-inducible transcriptional repressor HrcA [Lachnospiraceae bacterium]|nr:heat-inducible transcriptional repressor HrcA [Lachnospiraceae bacterium]
MSLLSERKMKILQAIINDYIATAEPVGSRTIAKKYDMGLSSATIRNEMSDLEDMGYIIQPYASAGRVPSDMGYRLYVDKLISNLNNIEDNPKEVFLKDIIESNISRIDNIMEETARAISLLTNYTAIITEPVTEKPKIKRISLIPLDERNIMCFVVAEQNIMKNNIIKTLNIPNEHEFFRLSSIFTENLKGLSIDDIDENVVLCLESESRPYEDLVPVILKIISKDFGSAENIEFHMSGARNILAFPEFSDVSKAKTFFQALEEKDMLITLMGDSLNSDMRIFIGNENQIEEMKNCSIITASYKMGSNSRGGIGIIGPTRMDYSQVITVLNGMVKNIERVLKILSDGNNDT